METLIRRAAANDVELIAAIGMVAVADAHRNSCAEADLNSYLAANYNHAAIAEELSNAAHIYHLLFCDGRAAGFSKILLDATHANIEAANATKLDRIYLLSEFHDKRLGHELLHHNVSLSKEAGQSGMWLFTWVGNERAVNFYKRNGFEIIGTHSFRVTDTHYNPNHHMLLTY